MKLGNAITWLGAAGVGTWLAVRAYRSLNAYDFQNKSVVVTGGTRGLGLVLARQLARAGARLAVCARDTEEVERGREMLASLGHPVLARVCDLREIGEAERFIRAVEHEYGQIDVLINNAGTINVGPEATQTRADFINAMAINFWAALHTIQAAVPAMRQRGAGRIVNITSIGGKVSVPHLLPYSASKFALVGLSEGLRAELAGDGIVVTTVVPGLMTTGSPRNATFKGQHRAEYAWFAIGDALPGLSMNAERAARRILNACRRGDAEVIVGIPAQLAVLIHGVMPGLTSDVLGAVNRFLPGPGGIGKDGLPGRDSESELAPFWLTAPNERAAEQNNEIPAPQRP
ncbi:MAG: SDR family NAD(P)-dependent oxidoreductase [Gemmataceae bacterium]|nr:SDR family NAD(P)-dependent oxidoreductase [Gemmataceae bacterium]